MRIELDRRVLDLKSKYLRFILSNNNMSNLTKKKIIIASCIIVIFWLGVFAYFNMAVSDTPTITEQSIITWTTSDAIETWTTLSWDVLSWSIMTWASTGIMSSWDESIIENIIYNSWNISITKEISTEEDMLDNSYGEETVVKDYCTWYGWLQVWTYYKINGLTWHRDSVVVRKYDTDYAKQNCLESYNNTITYIKVKLPATANNNQGIGGYCESLPILMGGDCVIKKISVDNVIWFWKIGFYMNSSPQDFIPELNWYIIYNNDIFHIYDRNNDTVNKRLNEMLQSDNIEIINDQLINKSIEGTKLEILNLLPIILYDSQIK